MPNHTSPLIFFQSLPPLSQIKNISGSSILGTQGHYSSCTPHTPPGHCHLCLSGPSPLLDSSPLLQHQLCPGGISSTFQPRLASLSQKGILDPRIPTFSSLAKPLDKHSLLVQEMKVGSQVLFCQKRRETSFSRLLDTFINESVDLV